MSGTAVFALFCVSIAVKGLNRGRDDFFYILETAAEAQIFSGRTLWRDKTMEYKVDDTELNASAFIAFVNQIWPGDYDIEKTRMALEKTINITVHDKKVLIGCLRILSDGYYFGTITELLVLPAYQKQGVGSRLLQLAKENTQTMLYFGAQPGAEQFYEKNGCKKSIQSYMIEKNKFV